MSHSIWACTAVALFIMPATGRGADNSRSADDTAIKQAVAGAMDALRLGDWNRYIDLMHPEALRGFKGMLAPAIGAANEDEADEVLQLFDGAKDVKSILALAPKQSFLSLIKGLFAKNPELKQLMGAADFRVIGTVHEGKDLAHCVVRAKLNAKGASFEKMEVISLKKSGAEWKMLLSGNITGLAESIKQSLKKKGK